ncbi:MAG TPA: MarR family transcriptional regulator [Jatrophihabitans sp.]|jgi:DNA-binding MarR family transcriptional regulator
MVQLRVPLSFDPIDRAGQLWEKNWPEEEPEVYASMRAITSIMRAQQVLQQKLDGLLRPWGINFSRFETLVLLTHSSTGALPLSVLGERLQVHATSVTNVVDRLEAAGLVRREPNPKDGRGVLATITEQGRKVTAAATRVLNDEQFGLSSLNMDQQQVIFDVFRKLRINAGDFLD